MDEKKETIKVSKEVLEQLKHRQIALNSANVLFQMAKRESELYMLEQLKQLGLDPQNKRYDIEEQTGEVREVKAEPVSKYVEAEIVGSEKS